MFPYLPERLKWKLKVLVTPNIWLRHDYPYCPEYDTWLNRCMDAEVPFVDEKFGWISVLGVVISSEEHPVSSFRTSRGAFGSVMCSRATSLRAWDYWQKTLEKEKKPFPPVPCKELD